MKKIFLFLFISFTTFFLFSKEIALKIEETNFGLKIYNTNGKKNICNGYLYFDQKDNLEDVYIIITSSNDELNFLRLAETIIDQKNIGNVLKTVNMYYFDKADENGSKYGPLAKWDYILVVPKNGKFKNVSATNVGKDLCLKFNDYETCETELNNFIFLVNQDRENRKIEQEKREAEEKEKAEKIRKLQNRKEDFEKNGSIGYDYFEWGTRLEDFLIVYPNAKNISKEKYKDSDYQLFEITDDKNNQKMKYYFYEKQLYAGNTLFRNVSEDKMMAINYRLQELYGKHDKYDEFANKKSHKIPFDDYGRTIDYKEEGAIINWNKSSTFIITLVVTARYGIDTYYATADQNNRNMMLYVNSSPLDMEISYNNPQIKQKVDKYLQNYDKIIEQEKIKKQMEKLDF